MENLNYPNIVLYTDNFEPITVIRLTDLAFKHLVKYRRVSLPVFEYSYPLQMAIFNPNETPVKESVHFRTVEIWMETIIRHGKQHFLLFTNDDENTLLLKSSFLAGQQREVNSIRTDFFAKGFLFALNKLGSYE